MEELEKILNGTSTNSAQSPLTTPALSANTQNLFDTLRAKPASSDFWKPAKQQTPQGGLLSGAITFKPVELSPIPQAPNPMKKKKSSTVEPKLFGLTSQELDVQEGAQRIQNVLINGGVFKPAPSNEWQRSTNPGSLPIHPRWWQSEDKGGTPNNVDHVQAQEMSAYAPQIFKSSQGQSLAFDAARMDDSDPRMQEIMQRYYKLMSGGKLDQPKELNGMPMNGSPFKV